MPPRLINEIVHGTRPITADTALWLARYFGTTDRFWMNLQTRCDLELERDMSGVRSWRDPAQVPFERQPSSGARWVSTLSMTWAL